MILPIKAKVKTLMTTESILAAAELVVGLAEGGSSPMIGLSPLQTSVEL